MSAVRIAADERIGRTAGEPYLAVILERTATLDRGLEAVSEREVRNIRLEVGFREPHKFYLAPRHLDDLIDLLRKARDRMHDRPIEDTEQVTA